MLRCRRTPTAAEPITVLLLEPEWVFVKEDADERLSIHDSAGDLQVSELCY